MRKPIFTEKGARPTGPYSQAYIAEGPMVFVAGQGPIDPATGEFHFGTFREQAELTFQNISIILEAAGTSWANVVRVGVYLADRGNFSEMNEIYKRYAESPYPARTTIQVTLRPQMEIEVDCVAVIPHEPN